ncbi:MAG: hypothetical protein J5I92_00460 [Thiogranum sp.]|nr:hypothetical protein [Thiogranum sp.]
MNKKLFVPVVFLSHILPATGFAAIDNNAPVVQLRTSCDVNGTTLDNCFTSMSDVLGWISGTRQPTEASPLKVDIGPGTFGRFHGYNGCYVTLSGSGRKHTIIDRGNGAYAITIAPNCKLDVEHLTVQSINGLGAINLGSSTGGDGGVTTWSDVEVISTAYGWTESGCSDSKHYWFNSRIETHTGFGITRAYSACSETWFFGSEVTAIANAEDGYTGEVFAVGMAGDEAHFYGSSIRAISGPGVTLPPAEMGGGKNVKGLLAISVGATADVHIHGTGIDVLSTEDNDIAALGVLPNGHLHANEAAYNMSTGPAGTITRIIDSGGMVSAPYLWKQGAEPPSVNTITGGDMAVETDCATSGCQTVGTETHLLISNNNCVGSGGPWFDIVTGSCR